MSINPLANRPRADACGFGNGLRRLPARDLPYNALSTARRQPGILMHVHPVLPWNLKLQQPQLPRSEPDGQPTESSQLVSENALAANLERTTREKMELAAKLVDHQEQERLDLARDLHDELAQGLSAMSAVAASIKATAVTQCPALVPEANSLSQLSMAVMRALRTTLRTLRPPEIDDFGLAA